MNEDFASPAEGAKDAEAQVIAGRYELKKLIGQGAMSKVYRGHDQTLNRPVAVKFLREEYGSDPDFVARFRREAQSVASLPGEYIVDIYDYGQHNGTYYIVMEFVEGHDLKEVIQREGQLTPERAIAVTRQVLLALKAAHAQNIIHRDIKPQNILVRASDGSVQLTDFGVAQARDAAQVTKAGQVIGTAHYMSPEQARSEPVSPATDLYALGAVLFEMLTGRLLYRGATSLEVIMAHLNQPAPTLASAGIAGLPHLEAIIQRALIKNPARRYQSADEMLTALQTPPPTQQPAPTGNYAPSPTVVRQAEAMTQVNPALPRPNRGATNPITSQATPAPAYQGTAVYAQAEAMPRSQTQVAPKARRGGWLIAGLLGLVLVGGMAWLLLSGLGNRDNPPGNNQASVTTVRPVAPSATSNIPPLNLSFRPTGLEGAYARDDGTLFGRPERALYGDGSGFSQGTFSFTVDRVPGGTLRLKLIGLDDERGAHCNFEVLVNDTSVFRGPNTFPNTPNTDNGVGGSDRYWGEMSLTFPANLLKAGPNRLTLRNTTPWNGSSLGIPYILINTASVEPER